jgi:hypothetical protein
MKKNQAKKFLFYMYKKQNMKDFCLEFPIKNSEKIQTITKEKKVTKGGGEQLQKEKGNNGYKK